MTSQCHFTQAMVVHVGEKFAGSYASVVAPGTPSLIKEQVSPDSLPCQSLSYKKKISRARKMRALSL
jgi:hypothetical protein